VGGRAGIVRTGVANMIANEADRKELADA